MCQCPHPATFDSTSPNLRTPTGPTPTPLHKRILLCSTTNIIHVAGLDTLRYSVVPVSPLVTSRRSNPSGDATASPLRSNRPSFHHDFRIATPTAAMGTEQQIHLRQSGQYLSSAPQAAPLNRRRSGMLTPEIEQPLLHAIVFLLQMMVVSILTRRFNSYYAARPGKAKLNP